MANNFRIRLHQEENGLHVKLAGDFDGMSALELINLLSERGPSAGRIFIDTAGLKNVHPFGNQVFANHWRRLNRKSECITFLGSHEDKFCRQ